LAFVVSAFTSVQARLKGRSVGEQRYFQQGEIVGVLPAGALDRVLDYKAPEGGCRLGDFVEVPLGPRKIVGVVWKEGAGTWDPAKVRSIKRVLEATPMQPNMRAFLTRAAEYTLTPMSAMLRLATRAPGLGDTPAMRKIYRLGAQVPVRLTPKRERVLHLLKDYPSLSFSLKELADMAGVTPSVVKGLAKIGAVVEADAPRDTAYHKLDPSYSGKTLSLDQDAGARQLRDAVAAGSYGTTLLKGVTGSGKTEVYLEAVAECLAQGRQALVLLPEIALTSEFLTRVEARFGARPAEWHSGVTKAERRRAWKMVGEGGAQLVVGARSALFLPFQNLGLIVVDEEHDTSYKQEDGVLYNARDMAVLRASISAAHVVLATATPSLESWVNAQQGKYAKLELKSRFGLAMMPQMRAVDMRDQDLPADRWISSVLADAVRSRIEKSEQSLLFINRRGYAPITLCRACGHQVGCDDCDARMVEHRFLKRLVCHQCGETKPMPAVCPSCEVVDKLAPVGPGVERLTEEAEALFEGARIVTLSSDHFGSARAMKEQIESIAAGDADVIIGTQLVAKGHNFPKLTLVGVIDADLGLQGSDLRAAERTFQLMRQVAGRAGRAEVTGTALLQTYQPDHPVIRSILSGDEDGFWAAEAAEREAAGVPPYGRMAGIILSSENVQEVFDFGAAMARHDGPLRQVGATVYGPAPAPIARIRGRHRVRMLVKADKTVHLQAALSRWAAQFKIPSSVRLAIDIDPQSFF
jgi:primosomal protein N' (replication factor Y)